METQQKKKELFQVLQKCKEYLDTNPNIVPEHLYQTLEAVCEMFLKWRQSNKIGDAFQSAGGNERPSVLSNSYQRVGRYLQNVNTQWDEISNALGIVAPENRQIRTKSLEFVVALIETLSLWIQTSPLNEGSFLFFKTLTNFLWNAIQGRTEAAVLDSLTLFSDPSIFLSQTGHLLLDCIQIVQPDSVNEFIGQFDENTRRMTAFFIIWCFTAFAPPAVQMEIPLDFSKSSIDQLDCTKENRTILKKIGPISSLRLAFDLLDIHISKDDCRKAAVRKTISKTHKKRSGNGNASASASASGTRKRRAV